MDRLSDPLIDYSGIEDDYIILERHQNGIHKRPRYHNEKVVYLDIIDSLSLLLTILLRHHYASRFKQQTDSLLEQLNKAFGINSVEYRPLFVSQITQFFLLRRLTSPLLNALKPKRVFLAPRSTFYHVIDYCKNKGITTVELEHGITVGETALYSGCYNPKIDPDYFFVFGKANIGPQFYMPLDRVRNIGFPYKNFIQNIDLEKYPDTTAIVASEPSISDKIVDAVEILARMYSNCEFHIRCHPQEKMNDSLIERIEMLPNAKFVSNSLESFFALSQYSMVLSENSSVLYEAMSLGKKVGRFNFCGMHVKESALVHGGTVLNSPEDFERFLIESYSTERDSKDLYSDYQPETFNSIL